MIGKDHSFKFEKEDVWKVKLMDKFQAQGVFCKGGTNCQKEHVNGKWSTIYDQSFAVELDNGLRFLANLRYSVKPDISPNPTADNFSKFFELKTGDYNKFDSQCDKTMIGFVQHIPSINTKESYGMVDHKVQCFYGMQETHYDMEDTVQVKTESDTVKVAVITNQNKIATQPVESINTQLSDVKDSVLRKSQNRFNAHHSHTPSDETDKAIMFINSQNFGWKADTCKLQKHHAEYGAHCEQE